MNSLWLALATVSFAQTAPSAATAPDATRADQAGGEAVILSPFVVSADKDSGYLGGSTLSGGRADTPLKLTPSAVSVTTRELMDDLNITDVRGSTAWTVSAAPANERVQTIFGVFDLNIRNAGGTSPTRNYFLFYYNSDSYNLERVEFSRGPNSVLFGDGGLGGIATSSTKIARLGRTFGSLQGQMSSTGTLRGTVDTNYGTKKFAVRANLLSNHYKGWRDGAWDNRESGHVTFTLKPTSTTQIRAEAEQSFQSSGLISYQYYDQSAFWDGKTVNSLFSNGAATKSLIDGNEANNAGIGTFGNATDVNKPYNVYMPYNPGLGLTNWQAMYRSFGTGWEITDKSRTDAVAVRSPYPVLPARGFFLGPVDAKGIQVMDTQQVYVDQKIGENGFVQLAYSRFNYDRSIRGSQSFWNEYRVDVNRFLPDGSVNPKFGVAYSEMELSDQHQFNKVEDYRILGTYLFKFEKLRLNERISLIAGQRPEHFDMNSRTFRRLDKGNINNDPAKIRVRAYWDQPAAFTTELPPISGVNAAFQETGYGSDENKKITYGQVVSTTTLFKDRASLILGARKDNFKRNIMAQVGNDSTTGITQYGGYNPAIKANQVGFRQSEEINVTSKSAGAVVFFLPWLAGQFNYSDNFQLPGSGANKVDGGSFGPIRGKGIDFGLKVSLIDNRLYLVLNRYQTTQTDRIVGSISRTEINRIWTNIGSTDPMQTQLNWRDTASYKASGNELEMIANPSRNISFTFNFALPKTQILDQNPGTRAYVAQNLPTWQAWVNNPANETSTVYNSVRNDINTVVANLDGIVQGATQNGTYRYTSNVFGKYMFTGGKLKGFQVGFGANMRGPRKIGSLDPKIFILAKYEGMNSITKTGELQYRFNRPATGVPTNETADGTKTNPTTADNRDAAFQYLYSKAYQLYSGFISYEHKPTRKLRAKYQLNVDNVFNNRELVQNGYGSYTITKNAPTGSTGVSTVEYRGQALSSYTYLDPLRFTFTTTLSF